MSASVQTADTTKYDKIKPPTRDHSIDVAQIMTYVRYGSKAAEAYLCASNFCASYRATARQPQELD